MADFVKLGDKTPFGKNVYLRSEEGRTYESYTFDHTTMPSVDIDGATQYILQPGTVLAKITASGKVGVYDTGAGDGRELTANIVGINDTFLPWQLGERDVEVAALYQGVCVLSWCFQYTAGVEATLTQGVADAIRGTTNLDVLFV